MIKLQNIYKIYQTGNTEFEALKGVNLEIAKGELVAIVGPSGSGKSTTMNILGLLDTPTRGQYLLDDIDTSKFSTNQLAELRNQRLGFIFQQFFLLPRLTALENVALPLRYRKDQSLSKQMILNRSYELLERVGVDAFSHHRPSELSGGQQQRVAIARALVGQPSIILADEPTGALDSKTTVQILALLRDQMKNANTTVVIITHDIEVARQCHREIHIRDGLIVSSGDASS